MNRYKNIFFLILLVFIFIEVLIIFPNRIEKKNRNTPKAKKKDVSIITSPPDNEAEQKMQGTQLFESKNGHKEWDLNAAVAESFKSKGVWELKKIKVQFYVNDLVEYIVTGDEGLVDKNKNIQIKGNVVTRSKNGYLFKTPTLIYEANRRMLSSKDQVLLNGPNDNDGKGLVVKGVGFHAEVDQNLMKIESQVQAQKEMLTKETQFDIVSESAEFSSNAKEFKFIDSVKINYKRMKIEGREALFNYGEGKKSIQAVTVSGGVKISDEMKYATSEKVKVDLNKDQYTFTGSPKVVQNEDEISGDQIVFLNGGKKVKVEKIKARIEKLNEHTNN